MILTQPNEVDLHFTLRRRIGGGEEDGAGQSDAGETRHFPFDSVWNRADRIVKF